MLEFFLNSFLFGVSIEIQFEYFCVVFFSFANHIYSRFTIDPFSIFAICFKFGVVFLQSFFATKKKQFTPNTIFSYFDAFRTEFARSLSHTEFHSKKFGFPNFSDTKQKLAPEVRWVV